jgi:hypothetical protein
MVREAPVHLTMEWDDLIAQPPEEIRNHDPHRAIAGVDYHPQAALGGDGGIR